MPNHLPPIDRDKSVVAASMQDVTADDNDGPVSEQSIERPLVDRDFAAVTLRSASMRNFRGLPHCTIDFEQDLTVLVGRNNAGKSRILRALAIASGAVAAEKDDLSVPGESEASIDLVFGPRLPSASPPAEEFDDRTGSRVIQMVQLLSEDPVVERFAWRTIITQSQEGLGVQAVTYQLIFDDRTQSWTLPSNPAAIPARQRSIIAADYVQTRRDLFEDLSRRASPIRRILDDLDIPAAKRSQLEARLEGLGKDIVTSSGSLDALKTALTSLTTAIDEIGHPHFEPLPVRLEELSRSVSINLDTGSGQLPLRFHGAGSRSLASIQVQSVLYDRKLGRDGPALLPHPISLVEEPESHLHPQAQFELESLLNAMRGQVIVSSHSTHLASVVEPRSLRLLQRGPSAIRIVDLKPAENDSEAPHRARRPSMHAAEMERLRRLIERPFGELLFASGVVIGDGATERSLLPPLIRHALGGRAHGVCVVDPGGMGTELATAVVKFAQLVGIPWVLFSDTDKPGRKAAIKLVDDHGGGDLSQVVWVPDEAATTAKGTATEKMLIDFDRSICEAACSKLGRADEQDLLSYMTSKKGVLGGFVARELVLKGPWPEVEADQNRHWPKAVVELIRRLDARLPIGAVGNE